MANKPTAAKPSKLVFKAKPILGAPMKPVKPVAPASASDHPVVHRPASETAPYPAY